MSKICNNPCQKIICAVPDDLATYNLQNPPPPVPNPENAFLSVQVEVDNVCVTGTLAFTGTVPNWIQIDTINNRVVGIAGAINGSTQNRANARALAELNAFIAAQILAGNMTCSGGGFDCAGNPSDIALLTWDCTAALYGDPGLPSPFDWTDGTNDLHGHVVACGATRSFLAQTIIPSPPPDCNYPCPVTVATTNLCNPTAQDKTLTI